MGSVGILYLFAFPRKSCIRSVFTMVEVFEVSDGLPSPVVGLPGISCNDQRTTTALVELSSSDVLRSCCVFFVLVLDENRSLYALQLRANNLLA